MAGLTRYPFQRNTVALYNPSESTAFAAMNPEQTTSFATPVTRSFKPNRQTRVYFTAGLPAGLLISNVTLTGSASAGWTANYQIYNGTSSIITPATQPVILYQED